MERFKGVLGMTDTTAPRFNVGDRVVRHRDVYDPRSRLMHGTVTARRVMGEHYPEVYDVEWDEAYKQSGAGYLPHGLDPEETPRGGLAKRSGDSGTKEPSETEGVDDSPR